MLLKGNAVRASAGAFLTLLGASLPSGPQEEAPGCTSTCVGAEIREPRGVPLSHRASGSWRTDWSTRVREGGKEMQTRLS